LAGLKFVRADVLTLDEVHGGNGDERELYGCFTNALCLTTWANLGRDQSMLSQNVLVHREARIKKPARIRIRGICMNPLEIELTIVIGARAEV
jgi:hypothetical protein